MRIHKIALYFKEHVAFSVILISLIPYGSLLLYMQVEMHSTQDIATVPGSAFLIILFTLGVFIPLLGVCLVLRRLLEQRKKFLLRMLLEAYFSLILIFATAFAVIQASSDTASFKEMAVVWEADSPATLSQHRAKLHSVYFDSVYLSLITITTVGYGDMAPVSPFAKILTGLEGLAGVGFLGLALGHYFSVCLHEREGHATASRTKEDSS